MCFICPVHWNCIYRTTFCYLTCLKIVAQRKNLVTKVKDTLDQIKPATRVYLFATLFCTLVHLTGIPAPVLFSLDSSKLYELWRPFTSVSYLGAPSMSMANSLYFLIRYGQTLEVMYGMYVFMYNCVKLYITDQDFFVYNMLPMLWYGF